MTLKLSSEHSPPATKPKPRWPWLLVAALAFTLTYRSTSHHDDYTVCTEGNDIYTVDPHVPRAQCVSIREKRIHEIGTYETLVKPSKFSLSRQRVFQLPKHAIVVPGLADAHAHILENGLLKQLSLVGASSPKDVVTRVHDYIVAHPDIHNDSSRWIQGMGWDQTKWSHPQFPTAADLESDKVLSGRPIILRRVDGHAVWVSQAVLDLVGELPPSRSVEGGLIVRDSEGKPTGIFVDNAMSLVPVPKWSDDEMELFFKTTMGEALSYGLTSIHDAAARPEYVEFFKRKAETGDLPVRLYLMADYPEEAFRDETVPKLYNYGSDKRLTMRSVKLFADGALGSWGAALLEPYTDRQDTSGLLLIEKEQLDSRIRILWEKGWQVNVHCIGDRANQNALDIFQDILKDDTDGRKIAKWRPRIEHAQIMTPRDLLRIGELGVIPSVQPTHATSDMWYAEIRLGPNRIKGAYAYQALLQTSQLGVLPLGSDFPVEGVNPLLGFYAAVTRTSPDGSSPHGPGGWHASQKLTRAQALKGMTIDAAYASFNENYLGSLVPGKKADFVILDRDIMQEDGDPQEILKVKVLATFIDGLTAYGDI